MAILLLATDPSFILTDTFDWGPVAIEHLLLVGACLLLVCRRYALGLFCIGLALWNKAIFVWAIVGLSAGVLIAFLPNLLKAIGDRRRVARCLLGLALGSAPLVVYNIHSPNATARANIRPSFQGFEIKLESLRGTMDGSVLFGILTDRTEGSPALPRSVRGRVSRAIARVSGRTEHSLFAYGVILALLSVPLWWRSQGRSAGLFAIAFSIAFFVTMAAVRYTGSAHHIVLLYPMPQLLVGVALAALRPKWIAGVMVFVLCLANLLVVNQYIAQLDQYGAHGLFTDALYPLAKRVRNYLGRPIYPVDFDVGESLNLLLSGQPEMPTISINVPELPLSQVEVMVENPRALFVKRPEARE